MNKEIKEKIIQVCDDKIDKKGENVGVSFYAFFKNKNEHPILLMKVAKWWIETHQLDHFEKAVKIKEMIKAHPNHPKGSE
jgi:mannitol-1-phosphate/altronate dehydrogenase